MPPPPRPPERGTPAYGAAADQYAAAFADATRQAATLLHTGGALLVTPDGPWADAMLTSVAPGRGVRRVVCPHVASAAGPQPMFVLRPGVLMCLACLGMIEHQPPGPVLCDRCGRPSTLFPPRLVIAQRHLVIARGRLCLSCFHSEHAPTTTTPDASPGEQ